jgi:NADH:ubiquinone oxidoreductase subunit E
MEITLDSAKTLHQVGAVGESSKAPNFVINMKAPRPQKEEKVVVIENGNN